MKANRVLQREKWGNYSDTAADLLRDIEEASLAAALGITQLGPVSSCRWPTAGTHGEHTPVLKAGALSARRRRRLRSCFPRPQALWAASLAAPRAQVPGSAARTALRQLPLLRRYHRALCWAEAAAVRHTGICTLQSAFPPFRLTVSEKLQFITVLSS